MTKHREAFVITGAFLVFGAVWVLFSDRLLLIWVGDPQRLAHFLAFKGWVFVLMASTLIFYLVKGAIDRSQRLLKEKRRYGALWVIAGKRGAATILGIHPNTLRSRMQKLGIKRTI